MSTPQIIERLKALPYAERLQIVSELGTTLGWRLPRENKGRPTHYATRSQELIKACQGVTGCTLVSRTPRAVWTRAMVAYQLLLEGYTQQECGAILGKDHSTINHYKNKVTSALCTAGYADIQYLWKQFQNSIHNETLQRN